MVSEEEITQALALLEEHAPEKANREYAIKLATQSKSDREEARAFLKEIDEGKIDPQFAKDFIRDFAARIKRGQSLSPEEAHEEFVDFLSAIGI